MTWTLSSDNKKGQQKGSGYPACPRRFKEYRPLHGANMGQDPAKPLLEEH